MSRLLKKIDFIVVIYSWQWSLHFKWKHDTQGSHIAHTYVLCKASMSQAISMQRNVRIQIKVITIHPHNNGKSGEVLLSTPFYKLKSLL